MNAARLEHVNVTVGDIDRTAAMLSTLFGWNVRWRGAAINGGETAHVGREDEYVAIYQPPEPSAPKNNNYATRGGLNHIAVVVSDIDATEQDVIAAGYKPVNHGDYEPGRRFYFHDHDGIEFEVVSYE